MAKPYIRRQGKAKGSKFQKKTHIDRDAKRQKWLHHCLKTLHRELKKAKEFEVRKILRRMHQAKEAGDKQTGVSKHQQQLDASKLEAQLEAIRMLQLELLAKQVATSAGFLQPSSGDAQQQPGESAGVSDPRAGTDEFEHGTAQQQDVSASQSALARRVSQAGCVRKQLEVFQQQYKKLFGQAQKRKQHAAASVQEGAQQEAQQGDSDADADAVNGSDSVDSSGAEEHELDQLQRKQEKARFIQMLLPPGSSDDDDGEAGGGGNDVKADKLELADIDGRPGVPEGHGGGMGMGETASSDEEAAQGHGEEDSGDEGSFNSEDYDLDARQTDDVDEHEQPQQAAGSQPTKPEASKPGSKTEAGGKVKQQQRQDSSSKHAKASAKAGVSKKALKAAARKDKEDMLRNDPLLQPRKNRIGQRARRALYEKMYGTRANHLLKQKHVPHEKSSPDTAARSNRSQHDKKRGATPARAEEPAVKKARASNGTAQHGEQGTEEKLHPSWAARKAAKQKLAISAAAPPQPAKKVIFDDTGEVATVITTGSSQQQHPHTRSQPSVDRFSGRVPTAAVDRQARGGQNMEAARGRGRGDGHVGRGARGGGRSAPAHNASAHGRGGPGGRFGASSRNDMGLASSGALQGRFLREDKGDKGADAKLHPSWAAKQQMKQKQQALVPAGGTKIVFDD